MVRHEIQRKPVLSGETEVGTDGNHQRGRDDVFTTGESFRQLKRKMEQPGALSVAGVFLGKTV